MLSLTYFSTTTEPLDEASLLSLLVEVRAKNAASGLTGLLLHADGHFVQTLEGPDDVVAETFERITRDPRHRSVSVALREPVEARSYPEWSMGFRTISGSQARSLPGYSDYLDRGATAREPGSARSEVFHRAFRSFAP